MLSCDHLYHPFLNDPGTSQDQRLSAALSEDSPAIDDREIADFLNYFAALSHQINFYDAGLNVSDWGPFFSGDLPFLLSGMAATDKNALRSTLAGYTDLFKRRPSVQGLQLLFLYSWYSIVYPIQQWAAEVRGSGIPLETTIQTLIKDRLRTAIKSFIQWMNTAVKCFCIRPVDMSVLLANGAWGLTADDLTAYTTDFACTGKSRRSQLLALQSALTGLTDSFVEVLNLAGTGAADEVNEQFYSLLQHTGQQLIRPHLALLYAFLNQFLYVLDDLNGLTEKHLNYFFQNILQLAPGSVVPDQAYVVFSLQQQVPNYPLAAGLSVKDGKDKNGADIYFALDTPIVVTHTQATAFRTLFVNTPSVAGFRYVEGVYMAPDATKADGLTQAFPDAATASWPTLGAKLSQYTPPMAQGPIGYPMARIGFALASKVLLMNEGDRKVHIRLACRWAEQCGADALTSGVASVFADAFTSRWLIVTPELIDRAEVMGLKAKTARSLRRHYLLDRCKKPICRDDNQPAYLAYRLIEIKGRKEFGGWILEELGVLEEMELYEAKIWEELLAPQPVLKLSFSGAKGWVEPEYTEMDMTAPDPVTGEFVINLYAGLGKDQDRVTFFDKGVLGEDLGTTDPVVKVELNDAIKVPLEDYLGAASGMMEEMRDGCCLARGSETCGGLVSFYTFFRNVTVLGPGTHIHIRVCGVKNLVVQNDDSVLSAKKPFTPFGVKPVVPDFDLLSNTVPASPGPNLVGPNFYIGSAEVFLKRWHRISVNLNWKGVPQHFRHYYRAYIRYWSTWRNHFPKYEVNLSLLHDGSWWADTDSNTYTHRNPVTTHWNRNFFAHHEEPISDCNRDQYAYSFDIRPGDFGLGGQLSYDPAFAPLTSYSNSVLNGFLRLTMENQDFLHKIYPIVMAEKIIRRVNHPNAHLPNEPWTPTILDIALDYEAHAGPDEMQLIQLFPYAGTYKNVDINGEPTLFATFCDEGNLYIGLTGLVPGDGLNMLFAFAEATAETESGAVTIDWYYLAGNQWEPLRPGFEIIGDATNGLSTTGIVQYHFPDDVSNDNTILPAGSYWVRASVTSGAGATSETRAIVTQAVLASFVNNPALNDQTRPGNIPLAAGSIAKLAVPDPNIASVAQPYDSFGGHAPELLNDVYKVRVSEQLRHKGRAIQKWDYERIVLQQFPKVLRVKCITHSHALSSLDYKWDIPMAPGNIVVAVLPDPTKLTVTDEYEPTVPMSMLTDIETWLAGCISPFIRVSARNPRYEPIDLCVRIALQPGLNSTYYQSQLERDIRNFMAPWQQGNTDAFQFAQRLYSADLIQFIEGLDYVANLLELEMCHQGDAMSEPAPDFMDPLTPRSILVAGKIVVRVQGALKTIALNGWK